MSDEANAIEEPVTQDPVSTEAPQKLNAPQVIRRNIREQVEDVFHELGGSQGMIDWVMESKANKRIFYKDILPKIIPKQVQAEVGGQGGGPMRMVIEWADGAQIPSSAPQIGLAASEAVGQLTTAVFANEAFDD